MLTGARLLIVEEEMLIALDIQRVVDEANVMATVFGRNFKEFEQSAQSADRFDLAIVNPPRPGTSDLRILHRLIAAGTAVVVCSASDHAPITGDLPNLEWVSKPFSDDDLLAACARALGGRLTQ